MSEHLTQAKVKQELHYHKTPSNYCIYQTFDRALVWHAKQVENGIGEWFGFYTVVSSNDEWYKRMPLLRMKEKTQYRSSCSYLLPSLPILS